MNAFVSVQVCSQRGEKTGVKKAWQLDRRLVFHPSCPFLEGLRRHLR